MIGDRIFVPHSSLNLSIFSSNIAIDLVGVHKVTIIAADRYKCSCCEKIHGESRGVAKIENKSF